jgi:hypothetical protein
MLRKSSLLLLAAFVLICRNADAQAVKFNLFGLNEHSAAPAVKIVSPNGGETFKIGSDQLIQWRINGCRPDLIKVLLSTDGGKTYPHLIGTIGGHNKADFFKWKDVGPEGNMLRIKVVVHSLTGTVEDCSDDDFSIVSQSYRPQLRLLSPNGGELFESGSDVHVEWEAYVEEPYAVELRLSTNGGKTYPILLTKLDRRAETMQGWKWRNVGPVGTLLRMKIIVSTPTGTIADASDEVFRIQHACQRLIDERQVMDGATGADGAPSPEAVPTAVTLNQNYPNPFNPTTQISFDLADSRFVTLTVFDVVGRKVATLMNGKVGAGHHTVAFDARALPSGTYLYHLEAGEFAAVKKMILMK